MVSRAATMAREISQFRTEKIPRVIMTSWNRAMTAAIPNSICLKRHHT